MHIFVTLFGARLLSFDSIRLDWNWGVGLRSKGEKGGGIEYRLILMRLLGQGQALGDRDREMVMGLKLAPHD